MTLLPVRSPPSRSFPSKGPPWPSLVPALPSNTPSAAPDPRNQGSGFNYIGAVKKGLSRNSFRYVLVTEEERAWLTSMVKDKVVDKSILEVNCKIWENSLVKKILGPKILINILKEKIINK